MRKRQTMTLEPIERPTLDVYEVKPGHYVRRGALVKVRPEHGPTFTMEVGAITAEPTVVVEGIEQGDHRKFRAIRPERILAVLP